MPQSVKFSAKYRVYYEDTDAEGVVYYANYLKFFERCRTDFLRENGVNQQDLVHQESTLFVVKKCNIDYILPARLDDLIDVSLQVKELRSASVTFIQTVSLDNIILATCEVVIVCIDAKDFKPKKMSEEIRGLFLLPT